MGKENHVVLLLFVVMLFFGVCTSERGRRNCCKGRGESITTVSGTQAPQKVCSGDLIFYDNFDKMDFKKWKHELTLGGGGNWEFQWYTNNRSNSFAKDGKLFIKPTLTADVRGEEQLFNSTITIDYCTDSRFFGCERKGTETNVLNPVRSAKLTTQKSFAFKYGKMKVRAKMPTGDWLQPAIWMLPIDEAYGKWPGSGTIVLAQCRGNPEYWTKDQDNIGVELIETNLHWGPDQTHDGYEKKGKFIKRSHPGKRWDHGFHDYEMEWTPDYIKFYIDGELFGSAEPNATFWELGEFNSQVHDNPYKYSTKMAPFDEEFYLIVQVAVGGLYYWKDSPSNNNHKPWSNRDDNAATSFWTAKDSWLKSWKLKEGDTAALQIEYIKIWAL